MQDDIKAGNATFKLGLRLDHYDGLTPGDAAAAAPRRVVRRAAQQHGAARLVRPHAGDAVQREPAALERRRSRTACSATGRPLPPGKRNQVELGVQQGFGRWVVADVGYFNKHTDNGYDFGVLFDTPIVFPGLVGSLEDRRLHRPASISSSTRGFSAFVVMAHTNAIFSPPGDGGILLEAAGRRLPDRPRSEVQLDDQPAVRLRQGARRLGGAQLAVRLGPRGRLGRQTSTTR